MTIAVILVLGILWVAVLVPPILRARGSQGRSDSVGDFSYKLSTLGQANGTHSERPSRFSMQAPAFAPMGSAPASMSATQKRRRDVLFVLTGVTVATLFLAMVTRSAPLFLVQLLSDAALGGYVFLLIQFKQRSQEQAPRLPLSAVTPSYIPGRYQRGGNTSAPQLFPLRQTASG